MPMTHVGTTSHCSAAHTTSSSTNLHPLFLVEKTLHTQTPSSPNLHTPPSPEPRNVTLQIPSTSSLTWMGTLNICRGMSSFSLLHNALPVRYEASLGRWGEHSTAQHSSSSKRDIDAYTQRPGAQDDHSVLELRMLMCLSVHSSMLSTALQSYKRTCCVKHNANSNSNHPPPAPCPRKNNGQATHLWQMTLRGEASSPLILISSSTRSFSL